MPIQNPDVGPFDAASVFQARPSQWPDAPVVEPHIEAYDFGPPETAPTE